VLNGLQVAVRRGRVTAAYRDASLFRALAIAIDPETNRQAWAATLRLCERFGLTAYDAAYLELGLRRRLPLATLDGDLMRAAQAENVPLVGTAQRP
jgi:predicted nucleic acid-binding protein